MCALHTIHEIHINQLLELDIVRKIGFKYIIGVSILSLDGLLHTYKKNYNFSIRDQICFDDLKLFGQK